MEGPSSAQATLAHYWDDAADALTGDQQQPIASNAEPTSSVLNTVLVGAATIISVFWLGHWLNAWRRARRQKKFDLDLRRRHGIPDSDTRPFNVAYQAASIAARDARKSLSIQSEHSQTHPFTSDTAPSTANIQEGFRPQGRSRPPIPHFPGQPLVRVPSGSFNFSHQQPAYASASSLDLSRAVSHLPNAVPAGSWGPRYAADNFRATSVPAVPTVSSRSAFAVAAASGSVRSNNGLATGINSGDRRTWHSASRPVSISRANVNSQARSRKRLYLTADEEAEEEEPTVPTDKRSRTAGWGSEAMIDGDNEPTWAQSHEIEPRVVSESSVPQVGKSKGKRPADDGEGDLRTDGKRRHTKQRPKASSVQEKRGIKRERKEVDTASVLNDVMPVHKRGRAGDVDNDLSMVKEEEIDDEDDPTVSRNPLCGGRRIGQKWTSNGQEYMVGPNGDRLRLVNVKESRKKYYMPADSKHADNFHTVEVFVEKWLTEEQYARAKADGLLAWQENDNLPANIKQESPERIPLEDKENQNEEGLRAISTTAITLSRSRAANTIWNTPGQSPLQPNSPHTNPFNNPLSASAPQSPGPRRVKYSIGTVPAAALNANRIKSTWEKQEREATGLKILRERAAAQAAANAPPAPAPAPVPAPVVPTLAIPPSITAPSITVTAASPLPTSKPADKPAETKPAFSFAPAPKPAEPTPAAAAPTPAPANPFSFAAPKKDEPAKPLFPAAPATSSTPFPQLTPSASSATPALGAAPSTAPAPPAVTPSPFAAPAATPTAVAPSPFAAPASTAAAKPSPFAFSAPSQPPTTAAPAEAPKPFATPASTPFGTTPAPGAPAPFGTTPSAPAPAATKPSGGFSFGVTPAAPAATPAATPAGSTLFSAQPAKPATSGFSFNAGNTIANGASHVKPAGSGFSFSTTPASSAPASAGFGATAPKPNAFGSTAATTSATTPSGFGTGFGTSNATTGTAASSSPFAFSAPKAPAAAPTPSGFGAQPAAPTSNGFKFGETKAATPAAAPAAGSTFSFGAPAKPTVAIPTSNPFNAPSTTTPTTATNGGFTFGAAAAGAAASPGTPSKPVFNLGAAASPVMGTRTISTSKRVQRAMSKPPQ